MMIKKLKRISCWYLGCDNDFGKQSCCKRCGENVRYSDEYYTEGFLECYLPYKLWKILFPRLHRKILEDFSKILEENFKNRKEV